MAGLYLERNTFFRIKPEYRQYYWQIQKKPCTTKTCIPRISWGFLYPPYGTELCVGIKKIFFVQVPRANTSGIRRRYICGTELCVGIKKIFFVQVPRANTSGIRRRYICGTELCVGIKKIFFVQVPRANTSGIRRRYICGTELCVGIKKIFFVQVPRANTSKTPLFRLFFPVLCGTELPYIKTDKTCINTT